ncbi:MAG: serine hydrolase domain-containing protein [Anaerolineales bacterium]
MIDPNNPSISSKIIFQNNQNVFNSERLIAGIQRISDIFDHQIEIGLHPGAQLAVIRNGQVIVDRYGGYADTRKTSPITPETKFLAFSITKPLTSACIFKLIDENKVSLDARIGHYWPEFSCNGKEDITIEHILLHQSGLPKRGFINQILNISNREKISEYLAAQKPEYRPGTKTAYQYLNFGFILGEVIKRVSGIEIDEFLEQKFLYPMGLSDTTMHLKVFDDDAYAQLCSGPLDHRLVARVFNSANFRQAVIPAASLHSTARDLAVFFQMLLNKGVYAGVRYMEPETVELATSLRFEGFDESIQRVTRWGYGFSIGGEHAINPDLPDGMGYGSSLETFGHFGQRTSMAWADKRTGLVVVFLCNRFLSSVDYKIRLKEISDAVWDMVENW